MTRTRLLLFSSLSVVVAGALVGLAAKGLDATRPGLGPLPAAALVLPSDATFVMGFDVKRLMSSPIYERMEKSASMKPGALQDLERVTGILPARDVSTIVVAGTSSSDATTLVFGQFDLVRIGAALDGGGTTKAAKSMVRGVPVYSGMMSKGKEETALALMDSGTLAMGSPARIEALLAARAERAEPFLGSGRIGAAVRGLKPGSTFWLVGDGSVTKNMSAAGGAMSLPLPPLETLVVTGDLTPDVSIRLTGKAMDEVAAKQTADMARTLIALAAMQGGQRPELRALAAGLTVTSEGATVSLDARIPYELLDKLMPQANAAPATR